MTDTEKWLLSIPIGHSSDKKKGLHTEDVYRASEHRRVLDNFVDGRATTRNGLKKTAAYLDGKLSFFDLNRF